MERHQQESEQQVQTLLRETRRLQEENDVLRIQVSSSGPSRSRQPKSQRTNSKQNEEVSFPRNAKFPYDSQEVQLEEKFPLTCPTLLDESSDSTRILTKMRRDRKSQLSDTMRARLGPQTPDMEGIPRVETAQRFALIPRLQRRLDDMLSTPFNPYIINYEPPRGFMVSKLMTYDRTSDPFDHIMYYRQVMTLDIGNDALLCKVFPASQHDQALSWFHCLPKNPVSNFRNLSEAFVGHYLCSTQHK
ncbi:hypothetical protein CK203_075451 [Vitis vinifera]|uniref:Retrotransposon gag domain-containing protein n=1 Tax=Vitis vinifera TaxID=29760 RepID=A0A438EU94_VITVI|nr:hypothetical protein CK203_075451 [Vitis vinifera]